MAGELNYSSISSEIRLHTYNLRYLVQKLNMVDMNNIAMFNSDLTIYWLKRYGVIL